MAFVSKSKSTKSNLPDHQLIVKIQTSKGYITLGKLGLYNESVLHSKITKLNNEQLVKLFSKAELSIVPYSSNIESDIDLVL